MKHNIDYIFKKSIKKLKEDILYNRLSKMRGMDKEIRKEVC